MIIDLERKRSEFFWWRGQKPVPTLKERPNKKHDFSRTIWEFIFYGPDFSLEQTNSSAINSTTNENLSAILDTMKDLQRQNAILHNKVMEITLERNRRSRENIKLSQDKHHACTPFFAGYSESIEGSVPVEASAGNKRKVCGGLRKDKLSTGIQPSGVLDINDIVLSAERDVFDDKERKKKENDPELRELKKLHGQMKADEYEDGNLTNGREKTEVDVGSETPAPSDEGRNSRLLDDDNNI